MPEYRMVYAFLTSNPFSRWLTSLWQDTLPESDPLRAKTEGRLGEVTGWGGHDPHVSITDCQVYSHPDKFLAAVTGITNPAESVIIKPSRLRIHRGTHLVVDLECPGLVRVSKAIRRATQDLIHRTVIRDVEWNSAKARAARAADPKALEGVKRARRIYEEAGCPPLDVGHYFRLGMLVSLTQQLMTDGGNRAQVKANLNYFLTTAQPPWYSRPPVLHVTIASGLMPGIDNMDRYNCLWREFKSRFGQGIMVNELSIMGPDPKNSIALRSWDPVTQSFVDRRRHGFKVLSNAVFAGEADMGFFPA